MHDGFLSPQLFPSSSSLSSCCWPWHNMYGKSFGQVGSGVCPAVHLPASCPLPAVWEREKTLALCRQLSSSHCWWVINFFSSQSKAQHPARLSIPSSRWVSKLTEFSIWMNSLSQKGEKRLHLVIADSYQAKHKTSCFQIQIISYAHLWRAVNVAHGSIGDSLLECE